MMPGNMFTPELFRPEVDYPVIPYDHLLRIAAERNPDRLAIVYHDLTLVYREVVSMSIALQIACSRWVYARETASACVQAIVPSLLLPSMRRPRLGR